MFSSSPVVVGNFLIVAMGSKLVVVFTGSLAVCWGPLYLVVVGSLYLSQETHINLLGAWAPPKGGSESC